MAFTIEQLGALKEGTTPGPWEVKSSVIVWNPVPQDQASLIPEFLRLIEVILSTSSEGKATDLPNDAELAAASPALVDALIAEKKAHQKLRKRIEERIRELKQPLCSHMPEGDELDDYLEQWDRQSYEAAVLTEILEGNG